MGENGEVLIPVNLEVDEAQKALTQFARKAARTEIDIQVQTANMQQTEAEISRLTERLRTLEQQISGMQQVVDGRVVPTDTYDEATIQAYGETRQRLNELNETLTEQQDKLASLKGEAQQYATALQTLGAAAQSAGAGAGAGSGDEGKNAKGLGALITSMARRVFVFSVMTMALRAIRTELGGILSQNKELTTEFARLRGNLLTLINPIINALIPALTTALQILNLLIRQIGSFLLSIFGLSWAKSQKSAEKISKSMAGAAKSAKEMQRSLLAIDEINRLEDPNAGGGGAGGASASAPSFDTGEVTDKLYEIEAAAIGAMLGLGLILFLTGAKPALGLGLMVAGAVGLAAMIREDWNKMPNKLKQTMLKVMDIAAMGLIGIGTVLLLSGANPALGIGMILAGGALGVTAATLRWGDTENSVSRGLSRIIDIATKAMLALGVVLLLVGQVPIGLGLILGALTVRAIAPNWNSTSDKTALVLGKIIDIATKALLAIGVLLLLTGQIPLGLGIIATTITVRAISPNWNAATDPTNRIFKTLLGLISSGLLVLGVLLVFTGVNPALGFCMILSGAAGLAASKAFTWDFVVEKVKEVWDKVKKFYNEHIAPIFTKQFWIDKWTSFREALPQVIKGAINSAIALFNRFIAWVNDKMTLSWGDKYILGQKVLPAGSIRLLPRIPSIPMLAAGAVVPPNNQFLAMLGDNKKETEIVSPLSTMKEALMEALAESQQHVTVNVDGRQLFDIVVSQNNSEVRRTGYTPLMV